MRFFFYFIWRVGLILVYGYYVFFSGFSGFYWFLENKSFWFIFFLSVGGRWGGERFWFKYDNRLFLFYRVVLGYSFFDFFYL